MYNILTKYVMVKCILRGIESLLFRVGGYRKIFKIVIVLILLFSYSETETFFHVQTLLMCIWANQFWEVSHPVSQPS